MNPKHPFKWRHFQSDIRKAVCQVVLAVPPQLPPPGRDDAGEGANGGPYDGVPLGSSLRPRTGQTMQSILQSGIVNLIV
jgi:hypothetical protein